ncbi:hypothetical protein HPB48_008462 [Haemaphysalis longicornis]|uniref:Ig-like domain-containing protein n=1 Tax=Haemaphysalis longicornis TaxID=44386 RepID=A0A9J6FQD8_HAELO|nr:hypothetical protein HPB48_008462 [Haemaphysalis longicornis]
MPFSFAKDTALGDKVLLTCAVTRGTAPFSITWTHQGRPVANTANKHATFLTGSVATMAIEKVTAEDVGNYTCTVTNAAGSDSFTAALTVEGKAAKIESRLFTACFVSNSFLFGNVSCWPRNLAFNVRCWSGRYVQHT